MTRLGITLISHKCIIITYVFSIMIRLMQLWCLQTQLETAKLDDHFTWCIFPEMFRLFFFPKFCVSSAQLKRQPVFFVFYGEPYGAVSLCEPHGFLKPAGEFIPFITIFSSK